MTEYLTMGLMFWGAGPYDYSSGYFFSFLENREHWSGQNFISSGVPHGWIPRDQMLAKINDKIKSCINRQNVVANPDTALSIKMAAGDDGDDVVEPFVKFELHTIYEDDPLFYCSDLCCEQGQGVYTINPDASFTFKSGQDLLNPEVFDKLPLSRQ